MGIGIAARFLRYRGTELDFLTASQALPWYIVVALLGAEMIHGAQTVGVTGSIYAAGLSANWYLIIIALGFTICYPIIKKFRAGRSTTGPEIIRERLEEKNNVLSAALNAVFYAAALMAVAYVSFAHIAGVLFGWPSWVSMLVIATIMVIYVELAGMVSIAWVDMVMYVMTFVGMGLAGIIGIIRVGGLSKALTSLPASYFEMFPGNMGWGYIASMAIFFLPLGYITCAGLSRSMLSSKSPKEAQKSVFGAAIYYFIYIFLISFAGIAAYNLYPGLEAAGDALPTLMMNALPIGLSGIAFAGIIMAMICCADTCIFMIGTSISHDIYKNVINPEASDKKVNTVSRIIILIGTYAFIPFALTLGGNVIKAILFAYAIFAGALMFPNLFVFYVEKTKISSNAHFVGVIAGFFTALISFFVVGYTYALVMGAVVSLIVLLLVSAIEKIVGGS